MTPSPMLVLERTPRRPVRGPRPGARSGTRQDRGRVIACAVCLHAVTTAAERTERAGRHAHTFANPHGFVFHVGCFTSAPGCRTAGEPSAAFSWFPGYAWQVAECRGCGEHLGWLFFSEAGRFHALITNRLAEAGERT